MCRGYVNTSAVKSAISFIDGDKGILRYRGYPIEQLAERSNFTEVRTFAGARRPHTFMRIGDFWRVCIVACRAPICSSPGVAYLLIYGEVIRHSGAYLRYPVVRLS